MRLLNLILTVDLCTVALKDALGDYGDGRYVRKQQNISFLHFNIKVSKVNSC